MNLPPQTEEQSSLPDATSEASPASTSPASVAASPHSSGNCSCATAPAVVPAKPAAAKKMSCKNRLALVFVFIFQLFGFVCALWYALDTVRSIVSSYGPYIGLHLPAVLPDPKRDFVGLLLVIFVENSLSQIAIDFYTEANKPRISAACRFIPIMLGVFSFLHQL
ncbi:hypothetical protein [Paraburkholderia tropica]|uniref:hypothetical protein n=1 Tax=Paraburkholderia tropica TaxID=92647 RepID=UPI002AAFB2B9|nr:hypothetical protein [Paraburkholderia tropica]